MPPEPVANSVIAYIGLGANLPYQGHTPAQTLDAAVETLRDHPAIEVQAVSSTHTTVPVGPPGQPDYANACARLSTSLSPQELLAVLLETERRFGRDRENAERWGPRTLDLDLLIYADESIDEPGLTLPHPRMHERPFVTEPLAEIRAE